MSRIVWAVNPMGLDVSAAAQYGEVHELFSDRVNPFDPERLYAAAKEKFDQHDNADDCLVPCGNLLANMAAAMAFTAVFERVNLLVFDARTRSYSLRTVQVD